jgi:hypothetical protein
MSNSLQTGTVEGGLIYWYFSQSGDDIIKSNMVWGTVGYDLRTEAHEEYVAAYVRSVEFTAEMGAALFRQIRNAMIDARRARLLLEYEFAHTPSEDATFALIAEVKKTLSGMRVAFVNDQPRQRSSIDLAQRLSRHIDEDHNYFTATRPAIKWLLEA